MKILLINKLFEYMKNDGDIRQMVQEARYDDIRNIINSGDETIDRAKQIFRGIYDDYELYPSSKEYIARVVNELKDDKTHDESIRVAIVRQFLNQGIVYDGDDEIDINTLSEDTFKPLEGSGLSDEDRLQCLVSAVYDALLKRFEGVKDISDLPNKKEQLLYNEWKAQLSAQKSTSPKTKKQCIQKAIDVLEQEKGENYFSLMRPFEMYQKFNAVNRKTDLKDKEERFIYGKWTEHIKDKNKSKKDSYKLLTLANDLSEGIIKQNNKTRIQLLDFAVAFNMECDVEYATDSVKATSLSVSSTPSRIARLYDFVRGEEKKAIFR